MKIKRSISLLLELDSHSYNTIYPLPVLPSLPALPTGYTKLSESLQIENFKAYAKINSLPTAKMPDFSLEDSETDRLYKSLDLEWKSARKQLNLYIGKAQSWNIIGSISLLNPAGYPYRIYDLLQIYSAKDSTYFGFDNNFAVNIQDVGWGSLNTGDIVSIYCDLVQTIYIASPPPTVTVTAPTVNVINNITGGGGTGGGNLTPSEELDIMPLIVKDVSFTAEVNKGYLLASTTIGTSTVTLPNNPPEGSVIDLLSGNSSNAWAIDLNGENYEGFIQLIDIFDVYLGGRIYYTKVAGWRAYPGSLFRVTNS